MFDKKRLLFLVLFIFIAAFSAVYCEAQDEPYKSKIDKDTGLEIPPGMEIKKLDQVNVVVPEGTEVRDEGGVIFIESTAQYASRKFVEIENSIKRLEDGQKELVEKIEDIIRSMEEIRKTNLPAKETKPAL